MTSHFPLAPTTHYQALIRANAMLLGLSTCKTVKNLLFFISSLPLIFHFSKEKWTNTPMNQQFSKQSMDLNRHIIKSDIMGNKHMKGH
jgi:hypothetical protein